MAGQSLTHVSKWTEDCWIHVTAEEESRNHPGGTVSAESGLYRCDLCRQYVIFTKEGEKARHFKHSNKEKSKNCPERTFALGRKNEIPLYAHELPLRLRIHSKSSFMLEIGFVPIPESLLEIQRSIITISFRDSTYLLNQSPLVYSVNDRIDCSAITYLSVGNLPAEEYCLSVSFSNSRITEFWPDEIPGVDKNGSFFDIKTGKKIPTGGDIVLNKHYYFLSKVSFISTHDIEAEIVCRQYVNYSTWYVFDVCATKMSEETVRFFMDHQCQLTNNPVNIQPIWPVYIESPYKILHASKNFFFHFHGQNEVKFRAFPLANHHTVSSEYADVLEIECNGRQQLISAGYANVVQYTYLWESELSDISQFPAISVKDVRGNDIPPGELNEMPPDKLLSVTAQYDGSVIISKKSGMEKRTIHAGHTIEIDQLQKNTCIQIQQGLDVLYTLVVCPIVGKSNENEKHVLFQLMHASGQAVKVPHSIGATAKYLDQYPQIKAWLMTTIASGVASPNALKRYHSFIRSITK